MADIGAKLSSELTRIIECPYPAALSHLAGLLAHADVPTIRASIINRPPCAVSKLATLVYDALPLWAYTLRILSCLCQSQEFRDTLLLQSPGLLDALLNKANSSRQSFEDYAGLCVLLLSRPLPASTPLPASAQALFLRVFEKASRAPDESTLKPVYLMLNGACRNLLSLLPSESRHQFDEEVSEILSSNVAGQNQMLALWCFGIALLAEYPEGDRCLHNLHSSFERPTTTDDSRLERQWKTSACRKLFGSASKLNKTIQMACLGVIWASKGGVGLSHEDAIEGIRIASRTLQIIDRAVLEAWPKSNALARNLVPKLAEKVMRTNINPAIQLWALSFYATVAGEKNLPHEIVTQYEQSLIRIDSLVYVHCLDETISTSLQLFASQLQHSSIQTLVAAVLDACVSPLGTDQLLSYITLVEQISFNLPRSISFQTTMMASILSSELQDKIRRLVQLDDDAGNTVCDAYIVSLQQRLVSGTVALLLNLALSVQQTESALPFEIATALVKKQGRISHTAPQCSHERLGSRSTSISLFQQKSTPFTGQHLQDWRNRLHAELESQGLYQREAIVRSVAQICQNLETRCETVEEPLRCEKERYQELERRVVELSARVASLEAQSTDDRLHLEGLEDEKLNICDERDGLATSLSELEVQYSEAIREADNMLNKTHEDFNAKEMELRCTILTYEENSRAQGKEAEAQNENLRKLEQSLEQIRDQHTSLSQQHQILQHRLDETEQKLNNEYDTKSARSEEVAALKDRNIELELQLQGTEADLDTATLCLSDLQVSHQELKHSSDEAYKDLELKYARDMESAVAKAREDTRTLDAQLREALQRGQLAEEAQDKTQQEYRTLQASIPPLEDRIQELNDFCSEQEEELKELRAMRIFFLAGLGVASQHPLAIRSASRAQETAAEQTPRVTREHRRRKSAIQTLQGMTNTTRGTQATTSTAMEDVANASFVSSDSHSSQNGSTPKRPKPGPSFKIPAMQTPYTQKPVLSLKSVSKKLSPTKRSALRQLSPNRRHTAVGFAVSGNEQDNDNDMRSVRKRRGSLQGIEEADFDMDDFLAGTPLTPGNFATGTGRTPDDDDVTTTEM